MPAVSKAQNAAMHAAAAGHSTLGIPASVGREFVAATPSTKGLPAHKKGSPFRRAASHATGGKHGK